ncbi:class II aldolase/adducin family protein [Alkalibaculum sporogenes]|uniref:class II aldolase/adducin family protein n=1 Tax=Alkalibaculum sporogenes TaxID=2655001 RepID=UPI00128E7DAE|nr:class II aldolase/adducin family protein [Alkalibaculum sporogenes]
MDIRKELINAGLRLAEYKLITLTGGNVSYRNPDTNIVAITPSGIEYKDLEADDIVLLDLDGNVVEGKRKPSSDTIAHLQIYRERKDIHSIIHTHSPYASCFAILNEKVLVAQTTMANEIGGEVVVAEYAPVGSDDFGLNVLKVLGDKKAILLKNHGVLAFGKDIKHALTAAVMFEDTCKVYYLAKSIGQPVLLNEKQIEDANYIFQNIYGQ